MLLSISASISSSPCKMCSCLLENRLESTFFHALRAFRYFNSDEDTPSFFTLACHNCTRRKCHASAMWLPCAAIKSSHLMGIHSCVGKANCCFSQAFYEQARRSLYTPLKNAILVLENMSRMVSSKVCVRKCLDSNLSSSEKNVIMPTNDTADCISH
jgi:hypothetical protein